MIFWNTKKCTRSRFYGTLKAQVGKAGGRDENVILDVDVVGGIRYKKLYGNRAVLLCLSRRLRSKSCRERLTGRGTDAPEIIKSRLAKATFELSYAEKFNVVIVTRQSGKGSRRSLETH